MAKSGKVLLGSVLIVGGLAVGAFTGHWLLALEMAGAGVGVLSMRPVAKLVDQGTILENRVGTSQFLPVIYGSTRVAGAIVDCRTDPFSTSGRRLMLVIAWCHGSRVLGSQDTNIAGIDKVWFDNRLAVDGVTLQVPFNLEVVGESSTTYHLQLTHYLGAEDQTVDVFLNDRFPVEWPAQSEGKGVCYTVFRLWYNTNIYASGIPTVQAEIRGNKVYDPRDASWGFSANPALCIRDYLLSPIYGMGLAEENLDVDSFIDMANYCDEMITLPDDTTQTRFELNGWVNTSRAREENLASLCTACRGQVLNEGGKWRLVIRRQRSVSGFKVTAENTVEGSWQFILPGPEASNAVQARYVDPDQDYVEDTVQWPDVLMDNPYLVEDNNYEQRLNIDLPFTDNRLRAQQIAMLELRESRQGIGVTCTLKETALQVRIGDLVEVTYETPGWEDKVFDVAALLLLPEGLVRMVLLEYDSEVYDMAEQFPQPSATDTNLPNPFTLDPPMSLVLTSYNQALRTNDGRWIPRIRATWTASPDPFVKYYEFQAKKDTDDSWDTFGRAPATEDLLFYVYPVTDEAWDVRIRAVNNIGVESDWLEEGTLVVTEDPLPQILTITLANAHADVHTDSHSDVAHSDTAHVDTHADDYSDVAHGDSHLDMHTDAHTDDAHADSHSDVHGDGDLHMDGHSDTVHGDSHGDATISDEHLDTAHTDTHTDTHSDAAHLDSPHSDSHVDAHSDGQFGIGVALQADTDSASVRVVARIHGDHTDGTHADVTDPTAAEVRDQLAHDGRNVTIELIDVATGAQIDVQPGDRVRIGALAYSETGGGGVEGPLALANTALYTVAPVGANKWVPV